MNRRLVFPVIAAIATSATLACTRSDSVSAQSPQQKGVVEVVTLKLKDGVGFDEFAPIDKAVADEYASKQAGFVSRESAAGTNGEWVVIVHWRSAEDADASMAGFAKAPAASAFMSKIDASTMVMKRYSQQ